MEGQGRGEVVITKYPSRAQHLGALFFFFFFSWFNLCCGVYFCRWINPSSLLILAGKGYLEDW